MNRYPRPGFTLIELMVVITIIGILLALLAPVAGDAKERARSAKCVGNLKQLHTAVLNHFSEHGHIPDAYSAERRLYTVDANGNRQDKGWEQHKRGWVDWYNYETATAETDTGSGEHGGNHRTYWYGSMGIRCNEKGALYDHARDDGIYVCPSFAKKYRGPGGEKAVRSYVMNRSKGGSIQTGDAYRKILFADGAYWETYEGNQVCQYGLRWTDRDQSDGGEGDKYWYTAMDGMLDHRDWNAGRPKERVGSDHHGKANVVFLDGHVEKVEYTDTTDVCTGNWGEY